MEMKTVEELKEELHRFGVVDYVVFGSMLLGCSGIGIWYAWKSSAKSSAAAVDEYVVGGRNMAMFPVAMSLVATFISGISLIGNPTEMYLYGTGYLFILPCLFPMAVFFSYIYLPVFHELSLSSTYEYLERRYDRHVRILGSVLFAVSMITWLPLVIYVPALAFNQVTGINVHVTTPIVCAVCVFYTCLGGIKAVVWTDVIQTCIMIGALVLIVIKGTMDVGGMVVVFQRANEGGRLELPSASWDLTIRHTIPGMFLMSFLGWTNTLLNQNMIQRFIALPTLNRARGALVIYIVGIITIILLTVYTGLLAYAMYFDCDPLTTKLASNRDQILPLLVMEILGMVPGLPGLFVAGIFSASLSSLSTGLNSMAAVVVEDFIASALKKNLSNRAKLLIMKLVTVLFGALCVLLVLVVQQLGTILQTSISLNAIASGPVFGIFTAGVLLPWMNGKGALIGGVAGLSVTGFIILGAQNAISEGKIRFPTQPLSVDGCDYYFNTTTAPTPTILPIPDDDLFPLYKLSYMWYTPIGVFVTIFIGLLVSCVSGGCSANVDPLTVTPLLRPWVSARKHHGGVKRKENYAEHESMLQTGR